MNTHSLQNAINSRSLSHFLSSLVISSSLFKSQPLNICGGVFHAFAYFVDPKFVADVVSREGLVVNAEHLTDLLQRK